MPSLRKGMGPVGPEVYVGRVVGLRGHGGTEGAGTEGAGTEGAGTEGAGLGLYYYGDDHGAAAVVVADPLADDATG